MSEIKNPIYDKIAKKYRDLLILKDFGYCEPKLCSCNSSETKNDFSFGCGDLSPWTKLKKGEIVLDLGCGCGDDCIVAAKAVGEDGFVYGLDMLAEMIERAEKTANQQGLKNIKFLQGKIENIPLENQSVHVIISNCVINLSPEKEKVYAEMSRVLKDEGRIAIYDIVATKTLPTQFKTDLNHIACLSNSIEVDQLKILLSKFGFQNVEISLSKLSLNKTHGDLSCLQDYLCSASISAKLMR